MVAFKNSKVSFNAGLSMISGSPFSFNQITSGTLHIRLDNIAHPSDIKRNQIFFSSLLFNLLAVFQKLIQGQILQIFFFDPALLKYIRAIEERRDAESKGTP